MQIIKHEHARLTVRNSGESLIIDPGSFSESLGDLGNVVGVVITHEHPDHWTPDHLKRIAREFPRALFFSTTAVAEAAPVDVTVVRPGDSVSVGSFSLSFFGGTHNEIHSSIPPVDNVGVLVNGSLYYPGDSYAVPDGIDVEVLAAPVGAPWLKIGEAMDYVLEVAPRHAFPIHEATLSPAGLAMHTARLDWATQRSGGTFHPLEPGESLDI
ncbi:MBL fold metallo-hydrolase [Microbacterium nanhaiense]|uniref:MBL fold metallo-hydrolase n=1 Tax=Microbacterium nanhaiense TaxID=1301026 RepID=A0ABQ2MXW8_9MICO|nr:MBL fold metallo-hydrolase [Microbacterium nanhaiense]GGO59546.1 MBL fold metallo-hydrolase [Microbacterium nanhaiense]